MAWIMATTQTSIIITELQRFDVLLGRGTGPNDYPGNRIFRKQVLCRKDDFFGARTRDAKGAIILQVIEAIKSNRGRFLQKLPRQTGSRQGKGKCCISYTIADARKVEEKTRQAFRYFLQTERTSEIKAPVESQGETVHPANNASSETAIVNNAHLVGNHQIRHQFFPVKSQRFTLPLPVNLPLSREEEVATAAISPYHAINCLSLTQPNESQHSSNDDISYASKSNLGKSVLNAFTIAQASPHATFEQALFHNIQRNDCLNLWKLKALDPGQLTSRPFNTEPFLHTFPPSVHPVSDESSVESLVHAACSLAASTGVNTKPALMNILRKSRFGVL